MSHQTAMRTYQFYLSICHGYSTVILTPAIKTYVVVTHQIYSPNLCYGPSKHMLWVFINNSQVCYGPVKHLFWGQCNWLKHMLWLKDLTLNEYLWNMLYAEKECSLTLTAIILRSNQYCWQRQIHQKICYGPHYLHLWRKTPEPLCS